MLARSSPLHARRGSYVLSRLLIGRARLLDSARGLDATGDLLVEDERIVAIGGDVSAAAQDAETVNAEGLCLAPGLVDMRLQLREPGVEHLESIERGGRAAAAGGITTMVALPNTDSPIDDVSVVEFRAREARLAARENYVSYVCLFASASVFGPPR